MTDEPPAGSAPAAASRTLGIISGRRWALAAAVVIGIVVLVAGVIWWTNNRSTQQRWSLFPHTMGCSLDEADSHRGPPPAFVDAQRVDLEHLGDDRFMVSVTFAAPPRTEPKQVRLPDGTTRSAPGNALYSFILSTAELMNRRAEGIEGISIDSPLIPEDLRWWGSTWDPDGTDTEVFPVSVSVSGRTVKMVLDLAGHDELLTQTPFKPVVNLMVTIDGPRLGKVQYGAYFDCGWDTPASMPDVPSITTLPPPARDAGSPRQADTPPPPNSAPVGVPGADAHGFIDHQGARCEGADQVMLAERTNHSVLVVCRGSGFLYYRGTRLSDGASITLNEVVAVPGGFDAHNASDGTRYEVRSTGLTIYSGGQVFVEPAVDYWASGTGTPSVPAPGRSPNPAQYVRTTSGLVRCVVAPSEVVCERTSADGFPQAPASSDGNGRWNLAAVDSTGEFRWSEGNIGGADLNQDVVLGYDQTYRYNGWTINAASDGTRFTNNNTGHGMFVSIEDLYPF